MSKPSKKFIKHGILELNEEYNPDIHRKSVDMEGRNRNYQTTPPSTFYTPEEMADMKSEIRQAKCLICSEKINDDRCRVCKNGHKWHSICHTRRSQDTETIVFCPSCRNMGYPCVRDLGNNMKFGDYNDTYSGGVKRRKSRNRRKSKSRKMQRLGK